MTQNTYQLPRDRKGLKEWKHWKQIERSVEYVLLQR